MSYIFLHGPLSARSSDQLDEFVFASAELLALGCTVVTALDNYPDQDQASDPDVRLDYLSQRRLDMLNADEVVLLDQWDQDADTYADVKYARAEGIKVTNILDFLLKFQKA